MTIHWQVRNALPILRTHDTSGAALYCLIALTSHANQRNRAWPTLKTLERETGYSYPTVQKSVQVLVDLGIVDIVPAKKRVGPEADLHHRHNVYQINDSFSHEGQTYHIFYAPGNVNRVNVNDVNVNDVSTEVSTNREGSKKEKSTPSIQPHPEKPDAASNQGVAPTAQQLKSEAPKKKASPRSKDANYRTVRAFYEALDDDDTDMWDEMFYAILAACKGWDREAFKKSGNQGYIQKHVHKIVYALWQSGHNIDKQTILGWGRHYRHKYEGAAMPWTIDKVVMHIETYAAKRTQKRAQLMVKTPPPRRNTQMTPEQRAEFERIKNDVGKRRQG